MNLTTVALALLAFKLLGGNNSAANKQSKPKVDLGQFLNDDTQTLLENVTKLQDKNLSQEEKTSAIFQLLTNPPVLNVLSTFTGGTGQTNTSEDGQEGNYEQQPSNCTSTPTQNATPQEKVYTPSDEA